MKVSQQLSQSGASPNLIKKLFSKLSFRQHSDSAVASFRPPEAPVTPQPNSQPTPILGIAEPVERASRKSLNGSKEEKNYADAPDVSKSEDSENASPPGNKRENIDSRYASFASTPTQDNDQTIKLKVFSTIEVPKRLDSRFFDLKVLYSQQLLQAILKDRKNRGDISMKLKYMGVDEKGAKPYIVIHCDKRVAKRVRKFFNQEHVLEDLGSDFQVHIVEGSLVSLAGLGDIVVWGRKPDYTLCGTGLVLTSDGQPGNPTVATLGGIIQVELDGALKYYGVTAGHAIARAYGSEYYRAINQASSSSVYGRFISGVQGFFNNWTSCAHGAQYAIDKHSEQEDDSDSDDEEDETPEEDESTNCSHHMPALASAGWQADGKVRPPRIGIVNGNMLPPEQVNYDWGLIMLHEGPGAQGKLKGNYVQCMSPGSVLLSQPLFSQRAISIKRRQSIPVVAITSRGLQAGTLAVNGSSMASAIGDAFVSVFDFIPNPNSELIPGDSGSWVVSEGTGEVYGHVVSVDSFGEAYIMPIQGTLDEIKSHLHADSVIIPSEADIMKYVEWNASIFDSGYSTMHNAPLDV
ncbi:hypothetical protein V8F06_004491 [Rhypophila decipiens]